jgi:hypothetical protein
VSTASHKTGNQEFLVQATFLGSGQRAEHREQATRDAVQVLTTQHHVNSSGSVLTRRTGSEADIDRLLRDLGNRAGHSQANQSKQNENGTHFENVVKLRVSAFAPRFCLNDAL